MRLYLEDGVNKVTGRAVAFIRLHTYIRYTRRLAFVFGDTLECVVGSVLVPPAFKRLDARIKGKKFLTVNSPGDGECHISGARLRFIVKVNTKYQKLPPLNKFQLWPANAAQVSRSIVLVTDFDSPQSLDCAI